MRPVVFQILSMPVGQLQCSRGFEQLRIRDLKTEVEQACKLLRNRHMGHDESTDISYDDIALLAGVKRKVVQTYASSWRGMRGNKRSLLLHRSSAISAPTMAEKGDVSRRYQHFAQVVAQKD